MKILIIGATGFIGRNMALHFANKTLCKYHHEVICTYYKTKPFQIDHCKWVHCNLLSEDDIKKTLECKPDIVIQAAATTSGAHDIINQPFIHTTDNAVMNSLLLRQVYQANIKQFVFFSCSIMYQNSTTKIKENDLDLSQNINPHYFGAGWTKVYIEKMCQFYATLGKTKFSILRHSNIYGPYDKFDLKRSHFLGASITKILSNQSGFIDVWGAGTEKRDLLYIDDLIAAVDLMIHTQKENFSLLNIGSQTLISVNDAINAIIALSQKQVAIRHDLSKVTLDTNICLCCQKAYQLLAWKPSTSFMDGLTKTIAHWHEHHQPNDPC